MTRHDLYECNALMATAIRVARHSRPARAAIDWGVSRAGRRLRLESLLSVLPETAAIGINWDAVAEAARSFADAAPFPHLVVDDFFDAATAAGLAKEFPAFDAPVWHRYDNAVEIKRTCNSWLAFPPLTYQVFALLNAPGFVDRLAEQVGYPLQTDPGLNGGGWHLHGTGGVLNVHLDYSLHPKLGLQRKLNLIVYLTPNWDPAWGGGLGLWEHDPVARQPSRLARTIEPRFNRAVLFDTTRDSWHGLPDPLTCPDDVFRRSLAVYYLTAPDGSVDPRGKALFAPTESQRDDPEVLALIARRAAVETAESVYRRDEDPD